MTEPLNAAAIVDVLNRHGVRYVVIGAFAAIAQRAPIPATRDIDLTPDSTAENLTRLSKALRELGTRIRTDAVDGGLSFDHDGRSLAASPVWNLICPYGEFDISLVPSGIAGGYEELAMKAHRMRVDAVDVMVADLSDVIRSKEAAGRPKDLQVLPILYRLERERRDK
jgi:Aminoglycoside-2''-adenylyltransferase